MILVLLVASFGILQSGFIPLLFLTGGGIWWLVSTDKQGKGADDFFSLLIPIGILAVLIVAVKAIF